MTWPEALPNKDDVLEARMKSSPGTLTNECEPGLIAISAPNSVPLNVLAEHRPFSSHRSARHGILAFGIGSLSDLSIGPFAHASVSQPNAAASVSECWLASWLPRTLPSSSCNILFGELCVVLGGVPGFHERVVSDGDPQCIISGESW